jgi:hypothetical protein
MAEPTGNIRQTVLLDGAQNFRKQLKGVTGEYDRLEKSVDDVVKSQREMGDTVVAINQGLEIAKKVINAVTTSAIALGQAFVELGNRGGDVSAVAAAFERLGDPSLIGNLNEITGGLVRNQQLMARSTQVLRTGIVGATEFTEMMELTTRAAQDMGRDVSQSIDAVSTALSGGGVEALNQLGVNVSDLRERVALLGFTMESTEGRLIAVRLAIQQMRQDIGNVDNSAGNIGDTFTQLTVTWENWADAVAQSVAENPALIEFFTELNSLLSEVLPDAEETADVIVQTFSDIAVVLQDATVSAIALAQAAIDVVQVLQTITSIIPALDMIRRGPAAIFDSDDDSIDRVDEALTRLNETLGRSVEGFNSLQASTDMRGLEGNLLTISRASGALEDLGTLLSDDIPQAAGAAERAMGDALFEISDNLDNTGAAIEATDSALVDASARLDSTRAVIDFVSEAISNLTRENEALAVSAQQSTEQIRAEADALAALERVMESANEDFVATAAASALGVGTRTRIDRGALPGPTAARGRAGPDPRARQPLIERDKELQASANVMTDIIGLQTVIIENTEAEAEAERELFEARMLAGQERKEFESEAHELRLTQLAEEAEKQQQIREQSRETIRGSMDVTTEGLDLVSSTLGQSIAMQSEEVANMEAAMQAAGASQAQIAAATKDQTDQIERLKKAEGAFLVAKETVEAAISIAQAISSFASQDYIGGALHIVAAAAHGVAAGMAAARLGGGSASVPSAPTAGTFRPTQPENVADSTADAGGVNIFNVYSLGNSQEEMGRAMENAQWQRRRVGLASSVPGGIQYDA